jgi:hypothetical protein
MEHEVKDKDLRFIIDPDTMVISCAGEVKALKCGDHRAEKYTFEMPRTIEGHDMSLCNKVEIHFNNVKYDKETRETTTNKSFDEVQDFGISEADEDTVEFVWFVSGDATQLDGTLAFCIRFACMNGDKIEYQKFTEIYESIPVGATIWNTEAVAKEYADVLEAWRQEIIAMTVTDANITAKVNEALAQAKASGEFDGAPGQNGQDGKDGKDGQPGKDGEPGQDGYSPTVAVINIEGGHRVTITDKGGAKTFDVMDGPTEERVAELINEALEVVENGTY